MQMEDVREYVRLRRRQREHEAQAAEAKELADVVEQRLLEQFAADGVQSINVDGQTIYLQRQLWAKVEEGVDRGTVVERLRQVGLGHFVSDSYNTQTLSSWLRELESEGEELPEELQGVLGSVERFNIRMRRS